MRTQRGQSAIEYILLATCVVAAMIIFLSPGGKMAQTIDAGINATVDQIGDMAASTNFLCSVIPESGGGNSGGSGGGDCICASSSSIPCGQTYYDECHNFCGLGTSCPAPDPGCTMICKSGACLEDCGGGGGDDTGSGGGGDDTGTGGPHL